jgi:type IV pilus assembly protein PilK
MTAQTPKPPQQGKPAASWSMQALPELSEDDFAKWRRLLEERTGIHLVPQQKAFLQSQLTIRTRELANISFDEYYSSLQEGLRSVVEWSTLVDRLVVKETSFFRHEPSFNFIHDYVNRRIATGTLADSFDAWSVGCATGEEPYTLAMIIDECFASASLDTYWGVTGMDISMPALNFARQGIYSRRKLDMITPALRDRHFTEYDQLRSHISAAMRERVCFTSGNVIELKKMPLVKMDIISCNNMLIYFRRWRRRNILNSLAERLKKGGVLIIGLGEIVDWDHPLLEPVPDDSVQAYVCIK